MSAHTQTPERTAPFVARDPRFADVVGSEPRLELVAETDAHEGPVYAADEDALYFTTVRRGRVAIKRLDLAARTVSVVRPDANNANGMTLDAAGHLVVCEQGSFAEPARISRLDRATGEVEVLAEHGLGSPNDVVVGSDRAMWFTDPSYGTLQGFRPRSRPADLVCRLDPETGEVTVVADTLDKPNGLAFSPEGRVLYVGDSGAVQAPGDYDPQRPRRVLAFDLADERLASERLFADEIPGFPDGLKTDAAGRVYVSSVGGVLVYHPDGVLLGEIEVPGAVNFTFGGPAGDVLFITRDDAVWAAHLHAKGA